MFANVIALQKEMAEIEAQETSMHREDFEMTMIHLGLEILEALKASKATVESHRRYYSHNAKIVEYLDAEIAEINAEINKANVVIKEHQLGIF